MKLAVLFSGGKDSTYAVYLAKKQGYEISCLISIFSKNPESFMFHTPLIEKTKQQADLMDIPLIIQKTYGQKEIELLDLEKAIKKAKKEFKVEGIITGAVESVYQASRVQKICDKLNLACFNPLWQKNQLELLEDLIKNNPKNFSLKNFGTTKSKDVPTMKIRKFSSIPTFKKDRESCHTHRRRGKDFVGFKVIITGVFAYPFDKSWLGRKINKQFIKEITELHKKYKINPAGEGGEFETFVLDCPLFKKPLKIKDKKISGEKNSWKMEVEVE